MSGRRNRTRVRSELSLIQTPIRHRLNRNGLRERVTRRDFRGRFLRSSTRSLSISSPINPVRLILRFNNVTTNSPIYTNPGSPINTENNIINTPPHRVVSNEQIFGIQDEEPIINDFDLLLPIPTFDLSREISSLNNRLFESEYAYNHVRLNNYDLEDFINLSI